VLVALVRSLREIRDTEDRDLALCCGQMLAGEQRATELEDGRSAAGIPATARNTLRGGSVPRIRVASAESSASVGSGRPGVLMAVLWCVSGNGAAAARQIVAG
jgi:hypothetical protein